MESVDESKALRWVVEGVASGTGKEFFRSLVRNLARVLGTSGAWVTEYLPEEGRLRAFAMWLDDRFVEDYAYCIKGTACADVVEQRELIHIPDRNRYQSHHLEFPPFAGRQIA